LSFGAPNHVRFCATKRDHVRAYKGSPIQATAPPIQEAWQTNPSLRGYLLRATFFNSVNPQVHYERYLETCFAQETTII
jgi:hypothetical protein